MGTKASKRKLLEQIAKGPLPTSEWCLQELKKRYFFPGISAINIGSGGHVQHHAACAIFRSLEQYEFCFCSCGLLYDLEKGLADTGLIEVVYPRYWHDYYLQERGEDSDNDTPEIKASKQQESEECRRILIEIFGPPGCTSLSQIKKDFEENKRLLLKVFGKTFSNAFFHLEERLKKEIEDYRKHESYKLGISSS